MTDKPVNPANPDNGGMPNQPQQPQQSQQPMQPKEDLTPEQGQQSASQPIQPQQPVQPQVAPQSQPASQPVQPQQPAQPAQPYGFQPNQGQPQQPAQPQQPWQANGAQPQPCAPQPGQPYAPQPGQPYAPQQPRSEGKAIGALVCGILSIVFCAGTLFGLALGIVAIVLASSYVKQNGPNTKAKIGKICGIIGSILSALAFVFTMFVGCSLLAAVGGASIADSTSSPSTSSTYDDSASDSSSDAPSSESWAADAETEEAITQDLEPRLDTWVNQTPEGLAEIAQMSNEEFQASTGFQLSDIGIDPEEYAKWQLEGVTYEIEGVYVWDDGSIEVGVGFQSIGGLPFQTAYESLVKDYIAGGGDRNDTQKLHDMFLEAQDMVYMNEVPGGVNVGYQHAVFYYTQGADGSWQLDADRWRYEMENLFAPTRDYVMPAILNGE